MEAVEHAYYQDVVNLMGVVGSADLGPAQSGERYQYCQSKD